MVRGVYIDRSRSERMTFGDALDRYLSEVLPTKKPSTQRSERPRAEPLREFFGQYSLAAIGPDLVARYRDERLATPSQRVHRVAGTSTLKLGSADLHFHDLRHEAVSRLVEAGFSDQEVSSILTACNGNRLASSLRRKRDLATLFPRKTEQGMTRMWIALGDRTSSGGQVVTGSPFTDIDGKPVARVADQATCLKHQGTFPIVDGDPTIIIDGQPVALHGSKLACGCTVMAVEQVRVFLASAASAAASPVAAAASVPRIDGAYRPYATEEAAAKAWADVVLPVANAPEQGVEVGAVITRRDGKYRKASTTLAGS